MAGWLLEPGLMAVIVMLAATTAHAVGAFLARQDYLRLAQVAVEVAESEEVSDQEKRDLALNISIATSWYVGPLMFIGAPIMVIYLTAKAAAIVLSGHRLTEESLFGGINRQGQYADVVNKPVWKARPLLVVWLSIWLLPLLLILALTHGSTNLVRTVFQRTPLSVFSRLAH